MKRSIISATVVAALLAFTGGTISTDISAAKHGLRSGDWGRVDQRSRDHQRNEKYSLRKKHTRSHRRPWTTHSRHYWPRYRSTRYYRPYDYSPYDGSSYFLRYGDDGSWNIILRYHD